MWFLCGAAAGIYGGGVVCPARGLGRRAFIGLLGVGLASALGGCRRGPAGSSSSGATTAQPPRTETGEVGQPPEPVIPPTVPGVANELRKGPPGTHNIALTIDDGYCDHCVTG